MPESPRPDTFSRLSDHERQIIVMIEDRFTQMTEDPDYRRHIEDILYEVGLCGRERDEMAGRLADALIEQATPGLADAAESAEEINARFREVLALVFA